MAATSRLIAQVKWFDKKKGYGFLQDIQTKADFFVHHSSLSVQDPDTFRYLSIGEYVEYTLLPNNNRRHKTIAADVTGISRGLLMCECWAQYQKQIKNNEDCDENDEGGGCDDEDFDVEEG